MLRFAVPLVKSWVGCLAELLGSCKSFPFSQLHAYATLKLRHAYNTGPIILVSVSSVLPSGLTLNPEP